MTTTAMRSLRDHLTQQTYVEAFDSLTRYGVFNIDTQLLAELVRHNVSYIHNHGLAASAYRRYSLMRGFLDNWYVERSECPQVGDRVTVTATGRNDGTTKVYENALLTNTYGRLSICTQPMVPHIGHAYPPNNQNGAALSVSGGYFSADFEVSELERAEDREGLFWFWGETMCAQGGMYIPAKVLGWKLNSKNFY